LLISFRKNRTQKKQAKAKTTITVVTTAMVIFSCFASSSRWSLFFSMVSGFIARLVGMTVGLLVGLLVGFAVGLLVGNVGKAVVGLTVG